MSKPAAARAWVVIPARGGSKGVPGKNLQEIQSESLIARAVRASKNAARVERVFVSTDDGAIAAEARRAGAEVVDRPAAIAGDTASSEDALLHALDVLERRGENLPEILVMVQCTSPFVSAADIDSTISCLLDASADTATTVARSHGFLWRRARGGGAEGINHDKRTRLRRQDREPQFQETGGVYAMRVRGFREARSRFFGKTELYEVSQSSAFEIDDPEDLAIARVLAPLIEASVHGAPIPKPLGAVVFDFDGVMTDDRVVLDQDGKEAVICSRSDGLGIEMLRAAGVRMAVVSKERNPVVAERCKKLLLEYRQGIDDKASALRALVTEMAVDPDHIVYVGNDINDLECMRMVGLAVAVADAHPRVRLEADIVLSSRGGNGAVRELAERILASLSMSSAGTSVDIR